MLTITKILLLIMNTIFVLHNNNVGKHSNALVHAALAGALFASIAIDIINKRVN